jgi:hypothetical protein
MEGFTIWLYKWCGCQYDDDKINLKGFSEVLGELIDDGLNELDELIFSIGFPESIDRVFQFFLG